MQEKIELNKEGLEAAFWASSAEHKKQNIRNDGEGFTSLRDINKAAIEAYLLHHADCQIAVLQEQVRILRDLVQYHFDLWDKGFPTKEDGTGKYNNLSSFIGLLRWLDEAKQALAATEIRGE